MDKSEYILSFILSIGFAIVFALMGVLNIPDNKVSNIIAFCSSLFMIFTFGHNFNCYMKELEKKE